MDLSAIIDNLVEHVGLNPAIFTLCTTKYLFGVALAFKFSKSISDSIIFSAAGGVTGVFFYLYIYEFVLGVFRKEVKAINVKFNGWRRFMIKLKQKGGLFGIALLTPLILSIPIGVALSISLGSTKRRILIFHITSVVFWTLLIFGIYYGLGFDLTEMFK